MENPNAIGGDPCGAWHPHKDDLPPSSLPASVRNMSKRRILGNDKVPGHEYPCRALHQAGTVLLPSGSVLGSPTRAAWMVHGLQKVQAGTSSVNPA